MNGSDIHDMMRIINKMETNTTPATKSVLTDKEKDELHSEFKSLHMMDDDSHQIHFNDTEKDYLMSLLRTDKISRISKVLYKKVKNS